LPGHDWSERFRRPTSSDGIHEPKPSFIFSHEHDRAPILSRAGFQHCLDEGWKVFLKVSWTSGLLRGFFGRGITFRH